MRTHSEWNDPANIGPKRVDFSKMPPRKIRWKPMTGGRMIPSVLPCIVATDIRESDPRWPARRYKRLDRNGFVVERWVSDFPPQPEIDGLPVIHTEDAATQEP